MRALRLNQFGDPANLRVEQISTPIPTDDEVLVQIKAASVNPSDVKNVRGFMHQTRLPRTPGRDFAGTVVAGRSSLIGKEVWGTGGELGFTHDGTHADFILLPASAVVLRPAALSPEAAASSGVTFVTAAYGLQEAGIAAGQTVVVIGVFGGVGRAAAQIAQHHGARIIGAARNEPPANLSKPFATMTFVNSSKEVVPAAVGKLTDGRGADIVFDTVGGAMLLEGLKLLAKHGRLIEISPGRDPNVTINLRDFYHQEAHLLGVDSLSLDARQSAAILREFVDGFDSGDLTPPPIAATYKLEEAPGAYAAVEHGGEGRHVLVPEGALPIRQRL